MHRSFFIKSSLSFYLLLMLLVSYLRKTVVKSKIIKKNYHFSFSQRKRFEAIFRKQFELGVQTYSLHVTVWLSQDLSLESSLWVSLSSLLKISCCGCTSLFLDCQFYSHIERCDEVIASKGDDA